jgi:hypothetical protein
LRKGIGIIEKLKNFRRRERERGGAYRERGGEEEVERAREKDKREKKR